MGPGAARRAAGAGRVEPAAVRAAGRGGGAACGVAGAGGDAAPAARRLPGGVRGAAGGGGVVHRPGHPRRDHLQGVRVHPGGPDRRLRAQPRQRVLRPPRAAEGVLDPGARPGRARGADGGVRLPAADRPGRPGLQHAEHERGQRPAGVPGPGDRPPQAEGGTARPGRDLDRDRGRPAVGGELRLRGRPVRCLHATRSAGPLRHPVQQAARALPAAEPQDHQAGRPRRRRGRRRRADVRLAAGRGSRRAAELAAHRRRRQDRPRRQRRRRESAAPARRLRRERRGRPRPGGRRRQDQRDHLLRPPAAGHPRRPRPPRPRRQRRRRPP